MNLKNLLISAAALASAPLFATTYYVTPEGAGTKDGSSWENAFDVEAFREQALKNVDGDIYNLAGGTYKPSACIIFKKATYATINGSTDGTRTILSGDQDNNGYPTNKDLSRLLRFQTVTGNGNTSKPVKINNVDFTSVFTNMDTDNTDDGDKTKGVGGIGALYIDNCGYVTITGCRFYSNWADGKLGGAAVHARRSQCIFEGCTFSGNNANYSGGAVRLSSDKPEKGNTTFLNCVFKNNTNYHDKGGAIYMSTGATLNIINTTISGNKASAVGSAIFAESNAEDNNHPCAVRIINSTIAGNTITGDAQSGQIASTQSANIRIVNSIVVSNNDKTADFHFAGATASDKFSFISGGYNYVGSVVDEAAPATEVAPAVRAEAETKINWQESDNFGAGCTYASIFGENKLNSDNVIVPVKYVAGATNAQLTSAVSTWNLPADIDLTTDLNGKARPDGSMPGSFAITEAEIPSLPTSVIETIETSADAPRLVKKGNGIYAIEGAAEGITVYTINGTTVVSTSGNTVDLSSFANGMYILRSGNAAFKVMR